MIYSTDIDDLRSDVAANCRVLLQMCADASLNVKIVNTVRDQEKQTELYKAGTGSKLVSFHKVGVGLAFDICDKVKGYSDISFFQKCGAIGQKIGFEWGGGWTKTSDKPHFQWSENGKYSSADIIAGRYPATMPLYKEEKETQQEMRYSRLSDIPNDYGARDIIDSLMDKGVIKGDGSDMTGNGDIIDLSDDMVRMFVINYRAGIYNNVK